MTSPEDTQYAAKLLRRSILRAAEGTPVSAYAERLASKVIRHYQEACAQETDEYDPRTCLTAGELRANGILIPGAVPDCGWIPRGGVKASSAAVTQEDVDAGILRININYEFTQPFNCNHSPNHD